MGTRRRLALLALAAAVAVLVIAVPAQAAGVNSGSSQMTIGPTLTHSLLGMHLTVEPLAPMTEVTKWDSKGQMYWWFRAPMKSGGTYNPTTGVGKFYHNGSIRIVNDATVPQKVFRAEGIQIIASGKNSYSMSVNYPLGAYVNLPGTNYTRVILATSTSVPKVTHSGSAYRINGVKFKLTAAGLSAIQSVIGPVAIPTNVVFFDTNLLPVVQ